MSPPDGPGTPHSAPLNAVSLAQSSYLLASCWSTWGACAPGLLQADFHHLAQSFPESGMVGADRAAPTQVCGFNLRFEEAGLALEVRGQISYRSWRPQILLPSRSKLTFALTQLVSHNVTPNWGESGHNQHTPQGCVHTSLHSPRRLYSSAPYLGLSPRGSSAQSPHPHVQAQNCCPDGQCSLWYGCQGDQVHGAC